MGVQHLKRKVDPLMLSLTDNLESSHYDIDLSIDLIISASSPACSLFSLSEPLPVVVQASYYYNLHTPCTSDDGILSYSRSVEDSSSETASRRYTALPESQ